MTEDEGVEVVSLGIHPVEPGDPTAIKIREPEWKTCGRCQNKFTRLVPVYLAGHENTEVMLCEDCARDHVIAERRRQEGKQLLGDFVRVLESVAQNAGFKHVEMGCVSMMIPREIRHALRFAATEVAYLEAGELPLNGFGLLGGAGIGKTCAIGAFVWEMLETRLRQRLPRMGAEALKREIEWHSWPETVNRMRVTSTLEGGLAECAETVRQACEIPLLILDDLGSERVRGSYVDDWACSQLDLIVDARYRDKRPILYTSNLSIGGIVHKYGKRIFSRLACHNRPIELPSGMPDLRVEWMRLGQGKGKQNGENK